MVRGLHPILLQTPGNVRRALAIECPICREQPGLACTILNGKPAVHDARESIAFHGSKLWA
jgi:hypothetical protein